MKLRDYETVRLLGKGGMSEVYEAENVRLGARYALKLFTYEKDDAEVRTRFETEGRLLARLNHPRIVRVTDFGTEESSGRPFFVMDLVLNARGQTQSLADILPGAADEEEVGRWYDDIREALAYIHANGVIHRDLKLQNVLIGPDGHAVLTDFGISKIFDANGDGKTIVDTVNTIVKMKEGRSLVMGSVGYMAPELEMGVAASPQSDWYALGVIVYRLLTGTWCDARTDIVSMLETYDPVWRRILPKLLHANPQGRECLSYAEERRADREQAELEAEERFLGEKSRGHHARHWARCLAAACVVLTTGWAVTFFSCGKTIADGKSRERELQDRLAVPTFTDVCRLPAASNSADSDGVDGDDLREPSLVDAWVLTHRTFDDLKAGLISMESAVRTLERLCTQAESDDFSLFDDSEWYTENGDRHLLVAILRNAVREMRRRASEGVSSVK